MSSLKAEVLAHVVPSQKKEELVKVCSLNMGQDSVSTVADATTLGPSMIMPGAKVAHMMINAGDIQSPDSFPLILKETLLVNTSNHSGPYYMGQNLSSDIANVMSPTPDFDRGHSL